MKNKILLISNLLIFLGCSEPFTPKPKGYFRISLTEKEYKKFESNCNFNFLIPQNVKLSQREENCWFDLYYPKHNATIYLTHKSIENNLSEVLEESHKLVYDHSQKSDGIIEKHYLNPEKKVFGIMYDIYGNSASNLQFFATDSNKHFIRGALYFNNTPNADSLQPVKNYIKEDLQKIIESLSWS